MKTTVLLSDETIGEIIGVLLNRIDDVSKRSASFPDNPYWVAQLVAAQSAYQEFKAASSISN